MTENSLSIKGPEYPILKPGAMQEMLELFEENMGRAGINTLDLPHIVCPSGGSLAWTIQTPDGDESAKEVEGIVLAWRPGRIYWKKALGEGGGKKPPDCVSRDGFVGVGDPGGDCGVCPFAQFGSAAKGRGQSCKQIRQMLLVRPGEVLPYLLSVPPTSLKAAGQYFSMLFGQQLAYWSVTTKVRLERATNEDGIAYARMQFLKGRTLSAEERATLKPYHRQMRELLDPVVIDARDYQVVEEAAPAVEAAIAPPAPPEPPKQAPPDSESNPDDIPF